MFLVGLGEELWKKFLPKHLESLGASVGVVGLFGTAEDFFDALYQYPGGWLADYWGRRKAFLTFLTATVVGYLIYLFSAAWPYFFFGLAFVMVWQTMASPTIPKTRWGAPRARLRRCASGCCGPISSARRKAYCKTAVFTGSTTEPIAARPL